MTGEERILRIAGIIERLKRDYGADLKGHEDAVWSELNPLVNEDWETMFDWWEDYAPLSDPHTKHWHNRAYEEALVAFEASKNSSTRCMRQRANRRHSWRMAMTFHEVIKEQGDIDLALDKLKPKTYMEESTATRKQPAKQVAEQQPQRANINARNVSIEDFPDRTVITVYKRDE